MDSTEQTFEGKLLPRHLKMFRDMDSGRIELRYWKFEPILLFLIPFMTLLVRRPHRASVGPLLWLRKKCGIIC